MELAALLPVGLPDVLPVEDHVANSDSGSTSTYVCVLCVCVYVCVCMCVYVVFSSVLIPIYTVEPHLKNTSQREHPIPNMTVFQCTLL